MSHLVSSVTARCDAGPPIQEITSPAQHHGNSRAQRSAIEVDNLAAGSCVRGIMVGMSDDVVEATHAVPSGHDRTQPDTCDYNLTID